MKNLLIFFFLGLCCKCVAQIPDYYVYLVSGNVTIDSAGKKQKPVKQKQLLFKSDVLTLKKGAEVTLVDQKAVFFKLTAADTKPVSKFIETVTPKSADGVSTKFVELLFHELLDPSQDFEKFKKKNVAGVWGGVSRGDDCGNRILPMDGFKTAGVSIFFKWHKTSPSSNYSFEIYDKENKLANTIKVKDTVLMLKINETLRGERGIFKWRVSSEDGKDNCEDEMPIYFEILTIENEQKLVQQLTGAIGNETLERQLQQVDKLERNGLIDAASSRYAAIAKANAGDGALLKSYVAFLLKYGFEEKARAAWKP